MLCSITHWSWNDLFLFEIIAVSFIVSIRVLLFFHEKNNTITAFHLWFSVLLNCFIILIFVHLFYGKEDAPEALLTGDTVPRPPHIPITFFKFDAPSGMYQFGNAAEVVSVLPQMVYSFRFVPEDTKPYYVRYSEGMYDLGIDCTIGLPFFHCPWLKTQSTDDETLDTAFVQRYR